jgi:Flp pilus assembly protein TadG
MAIRITHHIVAGFADVHNHLTRLRVSVRGNTAVEFAVIGPTLALLVILNIDIGVAIYRTMQVQSAAQVGAHYVLIHGFDAPAINAAVSTATTYSAITASPAPEKFCGCATDAGVTATTCSTKCLGGATAGTYAAISARANYRTIIPYPLVPDTIPLSAKVTVKIP